MSSSLVEEPVELDVWIVWGSLRRERVFRDQRSLLADNSLYEIYRFSLKGFLSPKFPVRHILSCVSSYSLLHCMHCLHYFSICTFMYAMGDTEGQPSLLQRANSSAGVYSCVGGPPPVFLIFFFFFFLMANYFIVCLYINIILQQRQIILQQRQRLLIICLLIYKLVWHHRGCGLKE